jgi:hypothetical protein
LAWFQHSSAYQHAGENLPKKVVGSSETRGLLDLRLAGIELAGTTAIERELLQGRISERNQVDYKKLLIIVSVIQEATKIMVSGEGGFTKTADAMRSLRDALFPEIAEETRDKAKRTQEMISKELEKGPIKVQRLDYGGGKKKRR